jgi:hypothetical protein
MDGMFLHLFRIESMIEEHRHIYMSVHGIGLVDSISLPMVPGSIRAAVSLAADRAVCDFKVYEALTVRKQWKNTDI